MIEIRPRGPVHATVTVPGSKSYTNRALAAAALAAGDSVLTNALRSDDTRYMVQALNDLGIGAAEAADDEVRVSGCGGSIPARSARLSVGNAGTAMRFLTAILAAGSGDYVVDGNERMRQRPIQDLLDGLAQLGADARSVAGNGCPPVEIHARGLRGGAITIPGDKSSQYISALLLAAPYAAGDVEIRIAGPLVSRPYVEMTLAVMRGFGAEAGWRSGGLFVTSGRRYAGRGYAVESDASSASYFFAAAAVTGGRVRVLGLSRSSAQGDVRFVDALERMGCTAAEGRTGDGTPFIEVSGGRLRGIDIDMGDISDTAPTLAATAVFAEGPTRIRNVANMRIKETDRIAALAAELRRIGQDVDELPDGLIIHPRPATPAVVRTYDDHRMAMSFAVAGLRAAGIVIDDPACVSKTFPDFFRHWSRL